MRKYLMHFLVIAVSGLLLMGCMAEPVAPTETETFMESTAGEDPTVPTTKEDPAVTTTEETPPTDPSEAPTEEETQHRPTEESGNTVPYLQQIDRADQSVYSGPGYDYGFVGTVRKRGTYTIVEEAEDYEGNLWGKLKSGMGWVDLTQLRSEEYKSALLSANFAEDDLIHSGAYHYFSDGQEYRVPIAFRAYGTLRDVTIYTMEFDAEGPFPGEDLYSLPQMTEELPLVAELSFPGDMTTYGIRFTDEQGDPHSYIVYLSGRNGALMLTEE